MSLSFDSKKSYTSIVSNRRSSSDSRFNTTHSAITRATFLCVILYLYQVLVPTIHLCRRHLLLYLTHITMEQAKSSNTYYSVHRLQSNSKYVVSRSSYFHLPLPTTTNFAFHSTILTTVNLAPSSVTTSCCG
jgi:hypothetical protein